MITQTEIAAVIVEQGGDYFMALKGNQGSLFEEVTLYFSELEPGMSSATSVEKNRGKVERRKGTRANIDWIEKRLRWKGLKHIFQIETEIYRDGKSKIEKRYYITSLDWEADQLLKLSRDHWSIENQLYRTLDIHFGEDNCQEHDRNGAANLSLLRKLGLSLLKQIEPKNKMIIKKKKVAYSPDFCRKCLLGKF